MSTCTHTFWRIWRVPAVLAALTLFGLLAALLGTGVWHGLAWAALCVPIVVGLWHARRGQRAAPPR